MDFMKAYELWSTDPFFDEGTRNELIAIKDDTKEYYGQFGANAYAAMNVLTDFGCGIARRSTWLWLALAVLERPRIYQTWKVPFRQRPVGKERASVSHY